MKFCHVLLDSSQKLGAECATLHAFYKITKKGIKHLPGPSADDGFEAEAHFADQFSQHVYGLLNLRSDNEDSLFERMEGLAWEAEQGAVTEQEQCMLWSRLTNFHGVIILQINWNVLAYTAAIKLLKKHKKKTNRLVQAPHLMVALSKETWSPLDLNKLVVRTERLISYVRERLGYSREPSPPFHKAVAADAAAAEAAAAHMAGDPHNRQSDPIHGLASAAATRASRLEANADEPNSAQHQRPSLTRPDTQPRVHTTMAAGEGGASLEVNEHSRDAMPMPNQARFASPEAARAGTSRQVQAGVVQRGPGRASSMPVDCRQQDVRFNLGTALGGGPPSAHELFQERPSRVIKEREPEMRQSRQCRSYDPPKKSVDLVSSFPTWDVDAEDSDEDEDGTQGDDEECDEADEQMVEALSAASKNDTSGGRSFGTSSYSSDRDDRTDRERERSGGGLLPQPAVPASRAKALFTTGSEGGGSGVGGLYGVPADGHPCGGSAGAFPLVSGGSPAGSLRSNVRGVWGGRTGLNFIPGGRASDVAGPSRAGRGAAGQNAHGFHAYAMETGDDGEVESGDCGSALLPTNAGMMLQMQLALRTWEVLKQSARTPSTVLLEPEVLLQQLQLHKRPSSDVHVQQPQTGSQSQTTSVPTATAAAAEEAAVAAAHSAPTGAVAAAAGDKAAAAPGDSAAAAASRG